MHTIQKDWTKRRFRFYLIFGEVQNGKLPWHKTEWNELYEPLLSRVLQLSPKYKNTGVRVLEYKKEVLKSKKDNKEFDYYSDLKLGRLKWDNKSHQKWTTEVDSDIKFNSFESWTPIWTICDRNNLAPDIFISIQNEEDSKQRFMNLQFDFFIVIAIAEDLKLNCNPIISDFSKEINAKRTICQTRHWNKAGSDKNKNWTFNNWIQDTWSNGIYKGQSLHNFNFDDLIFEPYWEIIYKIMPNG